MSSVAGCQVKASSLTATIKAQSLLYTPVTDIIELQYVVLACQGFTIESKTFIISIGTFTTYDSTISLNYAPVPVLSPMYELY